MKYQAVFDLRGLRLAEMFDTESEAQSWLDSQNNNADYMTEVNFIDNNGHLVDGYIYTLGAPT